MDRAYGTHYMGCRSQRVETRCYNIGRADGTWIIDFTTSMTINLNLFIFFSKIKEA